MRSMAPLGPPYRFDSHRLQAIVQVEHWILVMHRGPASRKEVQHRPVELRQIAGLPAGDPVVILDDLLIDPIAAGIANVIADSVIAGEPAAPHQAGGDQQPGRVTNGSDGFMRLLHRLQQRLYFRDDPQRVSVQISPMK